SSRREHAAQCRIAATGPTRGGDPGTMAACANSAPRLPSGRRCGVSRSPRAPAASGAGSPSAAGTFRSHAGPSRASRPGGAPADGSRPVWRYALRRLALGVLIVGIAMALLFSMIHVTPGDPASIALGPRATEAMREDFRVRMGLDKPIPVQFANFVANAVRG